MSKDDSDSGCADVSHTESQGSNDDPDGFPPRLLLGKLLRLLVECRKRFINGLNVVS